MHSHELPLTAPEGEASLAQLSNLGPKSAQFLQRLLDAYTFQGGNLWPLVLVTTLIAPWLGARIRGVR
jgi:hypothetical protein